MNIEAIGYWLIIALLLGVAGYFAWKQIKTLRALPGADAASTEERSYQRQQAVRRLIGSIFMVLLAGMMMASYFHGLEQRVRDVERAGAEANERGETAKLTPEQKAVVNLYTLYVIALLLVVLLLLFIAALDFWAIQRYHFSQYRQIQAARKELVEEQAARLRHQRNGQH